MSRFTERIIFNGHELAQSVPDAHVLDIQIGAISMEQIVQNRPLRPGAIFAGKRDGTRNVTVTVELPLDKAEAAMAYSRMRAWADSAQPARMDFPMSTNGYLMVLLTSMTDLSVKSYYEPIELVFTAFDPYFCGPERQSPVGQEFTIGGDVEVDFKLTRKITQAISGPSWMIDRKRKIALSGTVGVGLLEINTATGNVTLNGESIKRQIDLSSRFYPLAPGTHIITGNAAKVIWSERWR